MIVNNKFKFVFIHNPRTAGMSLRTAIKEYDDYDGKFSGFEKQDDCIISLMHMPMIHLEKHHHIGHHLSAVYYVDVPPVENSPVRDSGSIVFHRPDPVNRSWVVRSSINPEDVNHCVAVRTGDLVIFPSHIYHSVNPWFGKDPRVAYAMNIIIKRNENWEPMVSEDIFNDSK